MSGYPQTLITLNRDAWLSSTHPLPEGPRSWGQVLAQATLNLYGACPHTLLTFRPQPLSCLVPVSCSGDHRVAADPGYCHQTCSPGFAWVLQEYPAGDVLALPAILSSRLLALAEMLLTPAAPWRLWEMIMGHFLSLEVSFKDLTTALSDSPKKTSDTCGQTGKPNLSFYISSSDTSLLPSQPHLPALQPSALPAITPKPAELPDVQNHSRLHGWKSARAIDSITKQNFHLIWDCALEHDLCILLCFFSFFFWYEFSMHDV